MQVLEYAKIEDLGILSITDDNIYSMEETRSYIVNRTREICPDLHRYRSTTEDGPYPFTLFSMDCEQLLEENKPGSQLWYIIRGKKKIFVAILTVKKAVLAVSERNKWLEFFRSGRIVYQEE